MLVVLPDAEMPVALDLAFGWEDFVAHELEEGGLALSVGANQLNPGVAVDAELEVLI